MKKKIVFITGGSRGIGLSLISELLKNNFLVINFSRTKPPIEDPHIKHISIDLSDDEHAENKFRNELTETIKKYGTQCEEWGLINNAATLEPVHLVGKKRNRKAIANHFQINLLIPVQFSSDFLFELNYSDTKKWILNVGSGAANQPIEGWSLYGASKAALHYFTKTTALEQSRAVHPADIILFDPGKTDTEMQFQIRNTSVEDFPTAESFKIAYEKGLLNNPDRMAYQLVSKLVNGELSNGLIFNHKYLLLQ